MKISFIITSTGWGGLEMNTLKLARLLRERGYEIHLITQEDSTIYKNGSDGFASSLLLKKWKKYFDFRSAKEIAQFHKKQGIQLVMVFDNRDLDVMAWTKKWFQKDLKIVYQQHMQIGINKKDWLHTWRFKSIDVWISPLEYLKNEVALRTRFPVERVAVIPLCLDVEKFTERKYSKCEARAAMNLPTERPLLGIIGRISDKKGQAFVVQALQKLLTKGIDLELLIFGSPTVNDEASQRYFEELQTFVDREQLEKSVHFVPHNSDTALFYNAIDLFVLASHSETYGMVTIEAMLSGLPVLATNSGGTSEILDYGKLGFLYEYGDFIDFQKQVEYMLSHPEEVEEKARKAKSVSQSKYAQNIEIEGIELIIRKLMGI